VQQHQYTAPKEVINTAVAQNLRVHFSQHKNSCKRSSNSYTTKTRDFTWF